MMIYLPRFDLEISKLKKPILIYSCSKCFDLSLYEIEYVNILIENLKSITSTDKKNSKNNFRTFLRLYQVLHMLLFKFTLCNKLFIRLLSRRKGAINISKKFIFSGNAVTELLSFAKNWHRQK